MQNIVYNTWNTTCNEHFRGISDIAIIMLDALWFSTSTFKFSFRSTCCSVVDCISLQIKMDSIVFDLRFFYERYWHFRQHIFQHNNNFLLKTHHLVRCSHYLMVCLYPRKTSHIFLWLVGCKKAEVDCHCCAYIAGIKSRMSRGRCYCWRHKHLPADWLSRDIFRG